MLELFDDLGVDATDAESHLDRGGVDLHTVAGDEWEACPCSSPPSY
jgi:hypothetical protein